MRIRRSERQALLDDPHGRKSVIIGLIGLAAACFFGVPPLVGFFQHETRSTIVSDLHWKGSNTLQSTAFWTNPTGVAYGDGRWVAVGSKGNDPTLRPAAWISTNGRRWRSVSVPLDTTSETTEASISSVIYANHRWLAVGNATAFGDINAAVWASTDGTDWRRVSVSYPGLGGAGTQAMNCIYADSDGFVAGGYENFGGDADAAFWYSTDGLSWERDIDATHRLSEPGNQVVSALTMSANGLFVAGGTDGDGPNDDAAIWTSRNGVLWTRDRNAPELGGQRSDVITGLASNRNGVVAVGATTLEGDTDAESWTSNDGTHWTRSSDDPEVLGGDTEQSMHAVVSTMGSFVAVGTDASGGNYDPAVWSTQNGDTWVRINNTAVFDVARRTVMVGEATDGSQTVAIGTMDNGIGQSGVVWRREP